MRCAATLGISLAWGLLSGPAAAGPADEPASARPNIVLILADDLGWGELGCYRESAGIPTPNIDALAAAGVRFTDAYVTCPVCAPTRAGILTGRYQQRFGFELNPGQAERNSPDYGLPRDQVTLAERLRAAGYETAMVGKWHLGFASGYLPLERGFSEFFGFLGGSHTYRIVNTNTEPILRGSTVLKEVEYLTDAFAKESVAFIERQRSRPFFLYLPFNAVHSPMEVTPDRMKRFDDIEQERRKKFAAMLTALDEAVGQVRKALEDAGATQNTLVFFLSDNGGPTRETSSQNGPLRGTKSQVWEGGVRVPFLLSWPAGEIPAGAACSQPVVSLDIAATVLAAAGVAVAPTSPPLDGVNLLPLVRGGCTTVAHEAIFWRFGDQWAVRKGDWKLLLARENGKVIDAPRLFNLHDDIAEARDLAAQMPEKIVELKSDWDTWNAQNIAPRWPK